MITHVCMPTLSVFALFMLCRSKERSELVIHYDILPRYLRGFRRFLKIPEDKIVLFISIIVRLPIKVIQHGDAVPDYPHLHLKAMETVTGISEQLIPELKILPITYCLEKMIGNIPSLAYTAKYLSHQQLFPQILSLIACYNYIDRPEKYIVVWDPEWPASWNKFISQNIEWIKFEFFKWPSWHLSKFVFIGNIILLLKIPAVVLKYIIKRGIKYKSVNRKKFKLISEFIDPERLNRTPYDADYWVDGENIKKSEVLFFLTNRQSKYVLQVGYTISEVKKKFQDKKYELTVLDNLSYSLNSLSELFSLYLKLIWKISKLNGGVFCRILINAWNDYLEFLPLFLNYSSSSLIYLTIPNGHTGVRVDDAIVTGLCRKYATKSYGCQTRTIYSKNFEYCFDCFDDYFSWGTAWGKVSRAKTLFIKNSNTVGCIYLDYLLPLYREHRNKNKVNTQKAALTVSIFPSDISSNHHYTKNFTKSFLITCTELAVSFPGCKFIIKSKDPEYTDIMLAEKDFYYAYRKVKNNFGFLDQGRYNYADLLSLSDIVIAIGFTTPGIEGMLLGKRGIFYSEWRCGGQAFKKLPDLVAQNASDLRRLFGFAVKDYNDYSIMNSNALQELDPFRDGRALSRIGRIICEKIT